MDTERTVNIGDRVRIVGKHPADLVMGAEAKIAGVVRNRGVVTYVLREATFNGEPCPCMDDSYLWGASRDDFELILPQGRMTVAELAVLREKYGRDGHEFKDYEADRDINQCLAHIEAADKELEDVRARAVIECEAVKREEEKYRMGFFVLHDEHETLKRTVGKCATKISSLEAELSALRQGEPVAYIHCASSGEWGVEINGSHTLAALDGKLFLQSKPLFLHTLPPPPSSRPAAHRITSPDGSVQFVDGNNTAMWNINDKIEPLFTSPQYANQIMGNKLAGVEKTLGVTIGTIHEQEKKIRELTAELEIVRKEAADCSNTPAIEMIASERRRQIRKGHDAAHDAAHTDGTIRVAAELILTAFRKQLYKPDKDAKWPLLLAMKVQKKYGHDPIYILTIAASMLAAEIDRLLVLKDTIHKSALAPTPVARTMLIDDTMRTVADVLVEARLVDHLSEAWIKLDKGAVKVDGIVTRSRLKCFFPHGTVVQVDNATVVLNHDPNEFAARED